jgi:predicted component of viral defense system (DUF524 family)
MVKRIRGKTVKDEDREITTASSLARIEAKLDVFKEQQMRHEASDQELARQTNQRLERIENRGEERNKELLAQLTKFGETVTSQLAEFSAKLNGVKDKQIFAAGGWRYLAVVAGVLLSLLGSLINFVSIHWPGK